MNLANPRDSASTYPLFTKLDCTAAETNRVVGCGHFDHRKGWGFDPMFAIDVPPQIPLREQSSRQVLSIGSILPIRRQVRFAQFGHAGERFSPVSNVFTYPSVPKRFHQDCYLSQQDEGQLSLSREKALAAYDEASCKRLRDAVVYLHGVKYSVDDSMEHTAYSFSTEFEAMTMISSSSMRGLEQHFMSDNIHSRRVWVVRKIISLQDNCHKEDSHHLDALLRSWSLKLSAPFVTYAMLVAQGDEMCVNRDRCIC